MKKAIGWAALMVLAAAMSFAPRASAQCTTGTGTDILFKWDADGFAYEPGYNLATFQSTAGNTMTMVAILDLWCSPYTALDPNDPSTEYTLVITGQSLGTVTAPFGSSGSKYTTPYTNVVWAVHAGSPRNAPTAAGGMPINPPNATVPANFADGPTILGGTIANFQTLITKNSFGQINGSFRGDYTVTGGTMSNLLCQNTGGLGLMDGLWAVNGLPAGYSGHPNGKFDSPGCPTPAIRSSWGKIKTLYH